MAVAMATGLMAVLLLVSCRDPADRSPASQAKSLMEAGRFEASIDLLEDALHRSPTDPELLFLYGTAQLGVSRPSVALWSFLAIRDDPDWRTRADLALVRVGNMSQDRALAVEAASNVLSREPDHSLARGLRAEAYIHTKEFEAALDDANWLIERDPRDYGAHATRLQALIGLEQLEEIEDDFDELERLWQDDAFPRTLAERYCVARAVFSDEKGDVEQAATRFEYCLDSFPVGRGVLQEAVRFFDRTEGPARGTAILEAALAREPSAIDLRETLASRMAARGETEAAAQLLIDATHEPGQARTRAWTALAYHYFDTEDFEASVAAWKELFEILGQPDEGILLAYSESLIHAGHFAEAEGVIEQLPEAMAELARGVMSLERDEPERALEHFDAGHRLWPNNAVSRFLAGRAAERAADTDRAIREFRHSVRVDAKETPAALHLARIHEAEGNLEEARMALVYFLKDRPVDVEGRLLSLRVNAQIFGPAVVQPALASGRWPREELGSIVGQVAELVLQTGGPDLTLRFLKTVRPVELGVPQNPAAMRVFVDALAASERFDAAWRAIDAALENDPASAAVHEIRGSLLDRTGAPPSEIRAAHERALELAPGHARSLAALGVLALREGRKQEARRFFERAGASDPEDHGSRRRALELAAEAGELEAAEHGMGRLLGDAPVDALVASRLAGIVLERAGDRARGVDGREAAARAERLAEAAVRFRGGSEAFAMLVRVHLAAGTVERAIDTLKESRQRQGEDPSLHYHLGAALRDAGRPAEAARSMQEAISLGAKRAFPERAEAEAALAELSQWASVSEP